MTEDSRFPDVTMRELALQDLDALEVPESDIRRVFLELADLAQDTDLPGPDFVVAQETFLAMAASIRENFKKRTSLQEQADFLRARRELKEQLGVEIPDHYNPQ
ncbi:hypothetical protein N1028_15405 [Herbiconiux sp. CPCC 203407]|uniref:Uncharacterized protein n=1 Tax=Herbiconiux oxytropis TaxID=2970915 RepID=A0AA42BVH9_9MICO|nr:hypothetical protein [Herbiconiux oxytropis]MCS5722322.1 hypothetical protein [Herbiconiux oxytropis]MCS5727281.1 hypothetical protein [Herbiconiux oxytropis]